MSPTIRSKGGLPLMIGGLVAGADECCCENPPPPFCYECQDLCSYVMNVTEPSDLQASGWLRCGNLVFGATRSTFMFDSILPSGFSDYPGLPDGSFYGGNWNGSRGEAWITPYPFGPYAFVEHGRYGTVTEPPYVCEGDINPEAGFRLWARVSASITCQPGRTPQPHRLLIVAMAGCSIDVTGDVKDPGCDGQWYWEAFSEFDLTSSCVTAPKKTCTNYQGRIRLLNTPITFSADGSTTSLGAYTTNTTASSGPMATWCQGYGEALRDELAATFRITSRPNCDSPVGCNCNASLGGMYVTLGNLKSKYWGSPRVFTIDSSTLDSQRESVYVVQWQGPFGFYEYEEYDEDGPQDGNGNFTQAMWRQRAELYCDIVDGVSQWYVLFTSVCYKYDAGGTYTHQSYDEWVGKLDCYKACEDLGNYIDADESVPMGEPYDIEYVGRTTVTGYLECEPPPRATISLSQIVTC